jgi:hypothetical protein
MAAEGLVTARRRITIFGNVCALINALPRHAPQDFADIQGVSRLVDITAEGDFLGFCDQKS